MKRILVLEDDHTTRLAYESMLDGVYEATFYEQIDEATQEITTNPGKYEFVLSDWDIDNSPDKTAAGFVRACLEQGKNVMIRSNKDQLTVEREVEARVNKNEIETSARMVVCGVTNERGLKTSRLHKELKEFSDTGTVSGEIAY